MQVIFECLCDQTSFGDSLGVFGDCSELNHWNPDGSKKTNVLYTAVGEYPLWKSLPLIFNDESRNIEFKFVIFSKKNSQTIWETCKNRVVNFSQYQKTKTLHIKATFNKEGLDVLSHENENKAIESIDDKNMSAQTDLSQHAEPKEASAFPYIEFSSHKLEETQKNSGFYGDNPILSLSRLHSLWGRSFDRPIEHYVASASATPLETLLEVLLKKNKNANSFLQKLEITAEMAQSIQNHFMLQKTDTVHILTAIVLYLTWIHSALIPCKESGSHYRPNHHATLAKQIFDEMTHLNLECKKIMSPFFSSKESIIILTRLILPLLPSFQPQFTCAAPLTRIRDIAHRNDIPSDIKNEIKHTIQNKLHRNAGPEDLIATEKLLERLTAEREKYSSNFLAEFIKFHHELKEFFNAQSLEERLKDLSVSAESEFLFNAADKPAAIQHWTQLASDFYRWKTELGQKTKESLPKKEYHSVLLKCLHCATRLRRCLVLATEHNNYSEKLWLTDITLEQYSFVLLSQLNQELEELSISGIKFTREHLTIALTALNLSVLQIQYNGIFQAQCHAIAVILNRMLHILSLNPETESTLYLQTYAVIEQVRQMTVTATDDMSSIFGLMVEYLASQLSVPLEAVSIFAEATIRASLFFQISRLTSAIFSQVSTILNESGVDVISEPQALPAYISGKLVSVETLDNIDKQISKEFKNCSIILLLKKATGDEELESLLVQKNVEAIILTHPIPSLSHLGIRARQNRIPFLSILHKKTELFQQCYNLIGKDATLIWTENNDVEIKSFQESTTLLQQITLKRKKTFNQQLSLNSSLLKPQDIELTRVSSSLPVIHSNSVLIEVTGLGTKAATCMRLHKLGKETGMFETPECFVLPFGCMEKVIYDLNQQKTYSKLLMAVEEFSTNNISQSITSSGPRQLPALNDCCEALQNFILNEVVPTQKHLEELNTLILESLSNDQESIFSLAVRSSANVEDLEQRSGAGLYDSVLNVAIVQNSLASAISKVWASLFSARAVSWRKALRIPQAKARMAILVQNIMQPEYCFVAHTTSTVPLHRMKKVIFRRKGFQNYVVEPDEWIYVEIAQGFGEVIASANVQGHPHKMLIHKKTDAYVMFGFATLPYKYVPSSSKSNHLSMLLADYSKDLFWISLIFRDYVAQQLRQVCMTLENIFQHPQDIEGGIKVGFNNDINIDEEYLKNSFKIMIVQSRAQLV